MYPSLLSNAAILTVKQGIITCKYAGHVTGLNSKLPGIKLLEAGSKKPALAETEAQKKLAAAKAEVDAKAEKEIDNLHEFAYQTADTLAKAFTAVVVEVTLASAGTFINPGVGTYLGGLIGSALVW